MFLLGLQKEQGASRKGWVGGCLNAGFEYAMCV